jgi:hypothetical protein
MCPACLANAVLIAVGATSGGGLTAFALNRFFRRKQTNKRSEETEMKLEEMEKKRKRAK